MKIKCRLITPKLFDMNKPRNQHIFGVAIREATVFRQRGRHHSLHYWPSNR